LPPFYNLEPHRNGEEIIMASREKYAGKRKEIEEK
jgi:hypothetical protein